jgi:hypothetical protein
VGRADPDWKINFCFEGDADVVLTFPYFRLNIPETIDYNRKVEESKG